MTDNKHTEPTVTVEAELILDKRLTELRQQLIQMAAREKAINADATTEITASDITGAIAKLTLAREDVARRTLKVLQSWQILAAIVAATTLLVVLTWAIIAASQNLETADRSSAVIAAISGVAALTAAALSFYTVRTSRNAAKSSAELAHVVSKASDESYIITSWRQLEQAMRAKVAELDDPPNTRMPLRTLMQKYASLTKLPPDEFNELIYILTARNQLAHAAPESSDIDLDRARSLTRKHLERARTVS